MSKLADLEQKAVEDGPDKEDSMSTELESGWETLQRDAEVAIRVRADMWLETWIAEFDVEQTKGEARFEISYESLMDENERIGSKEDLEKVGRKDELTVRMEELIDKEEMGVLSKEEDEVPTIPQETVDRKYQQFLKQAYKEVWQELNQYKAAYDKVWEGRNEPRNPLEPDKWGYFKPVEHESKKNVTIGNFIDRRTGKEVEIEEKTLSVEEFDERAETKVYLPIEGKSWIRNYQDLSKLEVTDFYKVDKRFKSDPTIYLCEILHENGFFEKVNIKQYGQYCERLPSFARGVQLASEKEIMFGRSQDGFKLEMEGYNKKLRQFEEADCTIAVLREKVKESGADLYNYGYRSKDERSYYKRICYNALVRFKLHLEMRSKEVTWQQFYNTFAGILFPRNMESKESKDFPGLDYAVHSVVEKPFKKDIFTIPTFGMVGEDRQILKDGYTKEEFDRYCKKNKLELVPYSFEFFQKNLTEEQLKDLRGDTLCYKALASLFKDSKESLFETVLSIQAERPKDLARRLGLVVHPNQIPGLMRSAKQMEVETGNRPLDRETWSVLQRMLNVSKSSSLDDNMKEAVNILNAISVVDNRDREEAVNKLGSKRAKELLARAESIRRETGHKLFDYPTYQLLVRKSKEGN